MSCPCGFASAIKAFVLPKHVAKPNGVSPQGQYLLPEQNRWVIKIYLCHSHTFYNANVPKIGVL
jgi:hypothetical protein